MKGFYIFEEEFVKGTVDCLEIGYIDHTFTHQIDSGTLSEEVKMHALVSKGTKTKCSPEDTYDFETGALIALMKMCGVDKVVRACNEAFSEDTFKTYAIKYERELNTLKKDFDKVRDLKDFYKKNYEDVKEHYDKLGDRNKYLIDDINKKLEYIKEKDEEIKKLKSNKDKSWKNYQRNIQKKQDRINELEAQIKASLPVWQKEVLNQMYGIYKESKEKIELPRILDINGTVYRKSIQIKDFGEQINKLTVDSLIEQSRAFTRKCVDEWLYKIPTKRDEMWENIFALHKENDVIIEVKKEDVKTFLHEIEDKIPEITWASDVKIFEAKGTIKDIYDELKTHNRIYFRLSKKNKLSYSSDLNTYLFVNLDMISYLPPMCWDLFKKGSLAVKVNYDNYKEFYEACEKELGKKPSTMYTGEYTVSICKKDGLFEVFTIEDQKKTGRKIVDWEDVRDNASTMEDPYDTWKW